MCLRLAILVGEVSCQKINLVVMMKWGFGLSAVFYVTLQPSPFHSLHWGYFGTDQHNLFITFFITCVHGRIIIHCLLILHNSITYNLRMVCQLNRQFDILIMIGRFGWIKGWRKLYGNHYTKLIQTRNTRALIYIIIVISNSS